VTWELKGHRGWDEWQCTDHHEDPGRPRG
jgi:hypothetical protein